MRQALHPRTSQRGEGEGALPCDPASVDLRRDTMPDASRQKSAMEATSNEKEPGIFFADLS